MTLKKIINFAFSISEIILIFNKKNANKNMEILVVDDNKEICTLLESILIAEGFDAVSCTNPMDFKKIIEKNHPKLIITDLLMSGFDGQTLTKKIKENPKTQHIKIMMMSAHPDADKISKTINVDAFITKPFEIDELVNKVEGLLK